MPTIQRLPVSIKVNDKIRIDFGTNRIWTAVREMFPIKLMI